MKARRVHEHDLRALSVAELTAINASPRMDDLLVQEFGIGRPSTYANIIATLRNREYVVLESKRFTPTDIGRIVNGFLTEHFTQYVDYDFTAKLEDDLDAVSLGDKAWVPLLESFWKPFSALVDDKEQSVTREQVAQARELGPEGIHVAHVIVEPGRQDLRTDEAARGDVDRRIAPRALRLPFLVHRLQPERKPSEVHLRSHEPETGIALEDSGKDQGL